MAKANYQLGRGAKLRVALLQEGDATEPTAFELTLTGPAAKDLGNSASITTPPLPTGAFVPAGGFISFVAPSGKEVMVQVKADAEATDTSISVFSIPEDIADDSVLSYPPQLRGRSSANLSRSGNLEEFFTFDSGGYAESLTTSITQGIECSGMFLPTDPGFATVEYAFNQFRQVWVELELPKPSAAYTKGRIYKGPCNISDLPIEISADAIIQASISLGVDGPLTKVDEVPTPVPSPSPSPSP